ncbi:MAG: hypothetical protein KI786_11380, partial [Mameliella sp.]|nr:hypothetical protein [Phaeodactylibacter sp.]
LADLGNILLFQPNDDELKAAFKAGAERLLAWQQPNGSWAIGYDHRTQEPVYADLQDFRPTFYGMMMAYRILGEAKYLTAAKKGADWIIEKAVNNGHFLGVCGDIRFVNDFATVQISQALLDLWEMTGEERYKTAAIETAKMYVFSIYTHPLPDTHEREVRSKDLLGWQFTQAGLSFEHGGSIGSATGAGPILLASHAGLFVRMANLTGNPFFAALARAAAWGRDAHVNPETSVASYYWWQMDRGAGNFPHHAWWQIGWLMDYLIAEANYRSQGKIDFPGGFMTAKVGPHKPYGFEPGLICGDSAQLIFHPETVGGLPPSTDWLMAKSTADNSIYLIFIQNDTAPAMLSLQIDFTALSGANSFDFSLWDSSKATFGDPAPLNKDLEIPIAGKGIQIVRFKSK